MPVPHLMPLGDRPEHEASERCVCGPCVRYVERPDGSSYRLIVHHDLDGARD